MIRITTYLFIIKAIIICLPKACSCLQLKLPRKRLIRREQHP